MQEKSQSSQIKDKLELNILNETAEFITKTFTSMKQKVIKKNYKRFTGEGFRNIE